MENIVSKPVITFDIETVPDYATVARAHHIAEDNIDAAKAILGTEFPKPMYHRIVCISALGAVYTDDKTWAVHEWASLHTGDRSEKEVIAEFLRMVDFTMPILVSFNGLGFDLPVIQARAFLHRLSSFHLPRYRYFSPYSDLHIDLCNEVGGRGRDRLKLDEACLALDLTGKSEGVSGGQVADLLDAGRYDDIADYCARDVAATFRLLLVRERFSGRLSEDAFERSIAAADEKLRWVLDHRPTKFVQTGV